MSALPRVPDPAQVLSLVNENGEARLTPLLIDRLRSALDDAEGPVVLRGLPGSFCLGLDLALLSREKDVVSSETLDRFHGLLDDVLHAPAPVVAAVEGSVLGGGVGLVAAADLVVATPDSSFSLPEVLVGLVPAIVLPALVARVGVARARWLASGSRPWPADDALRFGLVDELTTDLDQTLRTHLGRLRRADPAAVAVARALAGSTREEGFVGRAKAAFTELASGPRARRRIERFLDGEAPWEHEA